MDNDKKFIHQLVGVKKFKKKAADEGNSGNYEKSSGKSNDQHAHVFDLYTGVYSMKWASDFGYGEIKN